MNKSYNINNTLRTNQCDVLVIYHIFTYLAHAPSANSLDLGRPRFGKKSDNELINSLYSN